MLHHIGLFFHMASILFVGGGSVAAVYAETQLWKNAKEDVLRARAFLPILKSSPNLIKAGVVVFLLSGLTMLWSVDWVYIRQPWLQIKLVLFLSLPIRAIAIHGPMVVRIDQELSAGGVNFVNLMALKARTKRFHIIQYSIVAVIIVLAIFKFQ